jgi:hypothetical protein
MPPRWFADLCEASLKRPPPDPRQEAHGARVPSHSASQARPPDRKFTRRPQFSRKIRTGHEGPSGLSCSFRIHPCTIGSPASGWRASLVGSCTPLLLGWVICLVKLDTRNTLGAVAQLGEHLLCKQGVAGSIPVRSTGNARGTFGRLPALPGLHIVVSTAENPHEIPHSFRSVVRPVLPIRASSRR